MTAARTRTRSRGDRGSSSLELLGILPLLLVGVLAALQVSFAAAAVQATGTAARAAARAASQEPASAAAAADRAGRAALPGWLADQTVVRTNGYPAAPNATISVRTEIPLVIPIRGWVNPVVERRAWFPAEIR